MPKLSDLLNSDNPLLSSSYWGDVGHGVMDAVNRGGIAGLVGAPVDIANMVLKPAGLGSDRPVMGSEWLGEKMRLAGMVSDKRNPVAETLAGFVDPVTLAPYAMKAAAVAVPALAALGATAIGSKVNNGADLSALAKGLKKQQGIFAGVGAKTANLDLLKQAEQMKALDVPVDQQIVRYGDGTAMSVPAEPDLKDFNGNREAYEKASAEYNMLRMNALDSELKKYGIELQSGGLGSDKPFNYTNAVGGNSAYGYIPGFGEVRFSDHLRTGGMNNTTYNTPDEVMSALRENYKRKLSKFNNFNTVRAQLGLTDDGGKVNFFKIQEWLKNNPQQGEKKDPAYWARAAGLDTTKPGGWSFDYHEPKIPKGLFDE